MALPYTYGLFGFAQYLNTRSEIEPGTEMESNAGKEGGPSRRAAAMAEYVGTLHDNGMRWKEKTNRNA